jgi:alpha-L-fucosidase 2
VLHHNVDLWRASAPVDGARYGLWPLGGAWLCLHLWDHYLFTLDRDALARSYPILKGAVEFFLDFLVPHPSSEYLVTCPSLSPENEHPKGASLCVGPTMDAAILRDLFQATIEAARVLGIDADFCAQVARTEQRLPPYRVGAAGQLQEWLEDWDGDAPEPHHRHLSHLFGLYPSRQISPQHTPELAAAAKRTLEQRGDAATGWSLAWKINLWARLHDGQRASELLRLLLSPNRSYTNLFDAHPPFQIDGNFGGAAGILELLVQSAPGAVHLLPALPPQWGSGTLKGVRARGGIALDVSWSRGELSLAQATSLVDQRIELRVKHAAPRPVELHAHRSVSLL